MKHIKLSFLLIIILFINYASTAYADVGAMEISVAPKAVNFHLVDPMGRISGYTPTGILMQIPFMGYYIGGGMDMEITDPLQEWHTIREAGSDQHVLNGKYKLVLYGTNVLTTAHFGISMYWYESTQWVMRTGRKMTIWPNAVWTYEFDVPVTPTGTQLVLTRMSQPGDLVNDIRSAASADYIGNAKFVSELVKEINDIEAEKAKGKIDDGLTPAQKAKKEYTELLKEITEKYNKPESDEFVRQEAYTVLKEDIEYIINHL